MIPLPGRGGRATLSRNTPRSSSTAGPPQRLAGHRHRQPARRSGCRLEPEHIPATAAHPATARRAPGHTGQRVCAATGGYANMDLHQHRRRLLQDQGCGQRRSGGRGTPSRGRGNADIWEDVGPPSGTGPSRPSVKETTSWCGNRTRHRRGSNGRSFRPDLPCAPLLLYGLLSGSSGEIACTPLGPQCGHVGVGP